MTDQTVAQIIAEIRAEMVKLAAPMPSSARLRWLAALFACCVIAIGATLATIGVALVWALVE
jgi:hypothetical protein